MQEASAMEWDGEKIFRLIELYQMKEVLWNPKNNKFRLRNARIDAWQSIATNLSCDMITVKKKMASLISSFRREKAKMEKSIGSGKDQKQIYISKWFFFNSFGFLMEKDNPECTDDTEYILSAVECSKCANLTESVYRQGWLCRAHAPRRRPCKYSTKGCTYTDVNYKCSKHTCYYCQYSTWCTICSKDITGTSRDSHYTEAHGDITYWAGAECSVSRGEYFIIDCAFGKAVCRYYKNTDVRLYVYTPLPSDQLYKFMCAAEISHPGTGHTLVCIPTVHYGTMHDWEVQIALSDFDAHVHNDKLNTKITITKIEDPSELIL